MIPESYPSYCPDEDCDGHDDAVNVQTINMGNPLDAVNAVRDLYGNPGGGNPGNLPVSTMPYYPGAESNTPNQTLPALEGGPSIVPPNASGGPVRYHDGTVKFSRTDLLSENFNLPWVQGRSWANIGYDTETDLGRGWVNNQLPALGQVSGSTSLAVVSNATTARLFDLTGTNSYTERFYGRNTLTYNSGTDEYTLTTPNGVRFTFAGFTGSTSSELRGQMTNRRTPGGEGVTITRDGNGNVTRVERAATIDSVTYTERWEYEYTTAAPIRLDAVHLQRKVGSGSFTTVRSVDYGYYASDVSDQGKTGDLKSVRIRDGAGAVISEEYYRYYTDATGTGYDGGLKYFLSPESVARAAAGLNKAVDAASDSELAPYADLYFEYDAQKRVVREKLQGHGCSSCTGGLGEYTFSYTDSDFAGGFNTWSRKTIETLPDGNRHVVFTNAYAQVMLHSLQEMSGSTVVRQWITVYRYDAQGRLVFTAAPSAVTGFDEAKADLLASTRSTAVLGTEFRVGPTPTSDDDALEYPSVAKALDGSFVVAWQQFSDSTGSTDIFFQLYDAHGRTVGPVVQANDYTLAAAYKPAVAISATGEFVITWTGSGSGDDSGIFAREFHAGGTPKANQFLVNSTTTGAQSSPAVAMTAGGDYVIAWQGPQGADTFNIFARQFGAGTGNEFVVNDYTTGSQNSPSVSHDATGNFVIAWTGEGSTDTTSIWARQFKSDGDTVAGQFRVNTTTTGSQARPSVAVDPDGDFVVAWQSDHVTGQSWDVMVQRFNASATAQGSELTTNTYLYAIRPIPATGGHRRRRQFHRHLDELRPGRIVGGHLRPALPRRRRKAGRHRGNPGQRLHDLLANQSGGGRRRRRPLRHRLE